MTKDEKLVFWWLTDNCDRAGFWEIEEDDIVDDTGLSLSEVKGALETLKKSFRGSQRVFESKGVSNGGRRWLWLLNCAKIQHGTVELNPKYKFHLATLRRLAEMSKVFPDVKAYGGLESVSESLRESKRLSESHTIHNTIQYNKLEEGECEGEKQIEGVRAIPVRGEDPGLLKKALETDELFRMMADIEGFHLPRCEWWLKDAQQLKLEYNLKEMVDYVIQSHLNGEPVKNSFGFITNLVKKNRFKLTEAEIRKRKPVTDIQKQRKRIGDLYMAGKITDEECRRRYAEIDPEYAKQLEEEKARKKKRDEEQQEQDEKQAAIDKEFAEQRKAREQKAGERTQPQADKPEPVPEY